MARGVSIACNFSPQTIKSSLDVERRKGYSHIQRLARLVYAQLTANWVAGCDPMIVPATHMHGAFNFETMKTHHDTNRFASQFVIMTVTFSACWLALCTARNGAPLQPGPHDVPRPSSLSRIPIQPVSVTTACIRLSY